MLLERASWLLQRQHTASPFLHVPPPRPLPQGSAPGGDVSLLHTWSVWPAALPAQSTHLSSVPVVLQAPINSQFYLLGDSKQLAERPGPTSVPWPGLSHVTL